MYLTKMKIEKKDIFKHSTDYETHRTVCKMLPESELQRHLFCKKSDHVLILSKTKPEGEDLYVKEIPEDYITEGRVYRFRVKVNPTIKKQGKRIPLKGETQVTSWFKKREEEWGVKFSGLTLAGSEREVSFKGGNKITVEGCTVAGFLGVMDKEKFSKVFENGVGKARRLGYGMFEIVEA